jgi:predicted nuclease of restriction endonuclease-like (RecB) superfamily
MVRTPALPDGYPQLLERLKAEIGAARTRAALAVNHELIGLYWRIGSEILERQEREGWGGKVIDRLASDLRAEFPEMRGLSVRNLEYMRQFAASWPERQIPQQPVAKLPWGHNIALLTKLKDRETRLNSTRRPACSWSWAKTRPRRSRRSQPCRSVCSPVDYLRIGVPVITRSNQAPQESCARRTGNGSLARDTEVSVVSGP